jgi:hypothetical protein
MLCGQGCDARAGFPSVFMPWRYALGGYTSDYGASLHLTMGLGLAVVPMAVCPGRYAN